MIKATGKIDGETITVVYDDGKILFNNVKNIVFEDRFKILLEERPPLGGVYFPEKVDDLLNIMNVMENYFFDIPVTAEISNENITPIPGGDEKVVY